MRRRDMQTLPGRLTTSLPLHIYTRVCAYCVFQSEGFTKHSGKTRPNHRKTYLLVKSRTGVWLLLSPALPLSLPLPLLANGCYILSVSKIDFPLSPSSPPPLLARENPPFPRPTKYFLLFFGKKERKRESPLCRCVGLAKKGGRRHSRGIFSLLSPLGIIGSEIE